MLVSDLLAEYPAGVIRLLILDRRWAQDWDYDHAGLEAAAARLERLAAAAGPARPQRRRTRGRGGGCRQGRAHRDLDVQAALRIAEDEGGPAARTLGSLLGLW